uniref:Major facilitator superfamily (MFS) profile domain-containing protein n=1 Tax=Timema poppense TaxID=170557 RepID=A0A7R9CQ96_TIMPO|nr:unnamed protein product [Timema poppensis]
MKNVPPMLDLKKEPTNDALVNVSNGKPVGNNSEDGGAEKKVDLVPPDGGWGWAIVCGTALSNIIVYPVMQTFALLYKDKFANIGITATDASIIINVNAAFGMALGLVHGVLLKRFGYRKVGIIASLITFVGVVLTSFGNSFSHFLITYGLLTSLGVCLVTPAFSLALNSYFKVKRGKAMGFAMTLTGIGPVIMPPLISKLMSFYGVQGTGLILGALSLHALVGAFLLQPIKWHLIKKVVEPEANNQEEDDHEDSKNSKNNEVKKIVPDYGREGLRRKTSRPISRASSIENIDAVSIFGLDTPMLDRRVYPREGKRKNSESSQKRSQGPFEESSNLISSKKQTLSDESEKWWSTTSLNSSYMGSCVKIFDDKTFTPLKECDEEDKQEKENDSLLDDLSKKPVEIDRIKFASNDFALIEVNRNNSIIKKDISKENVDESKEMGCYKRFTGKMVKELDLTLFKDPYYVNLMLGMSIAICAEANFSLMTPFILGDLGFTNDQTAAVMSAIGIADIIFRFISPFFADYMEYSARTMYLISMAMLIASRTTLIFFTAFESVLIVGIALGIAKGVRTVYMSLVIPNYVPIERLASASGLQMVANGIIFMMFGPFIGFIRDVSGSYNLAIVAINSLTAITATMWLTEIVIVKCRHNQKSRTGS